MQTVEPVKEETDADCRASKGEERLMQTVEPVKEGD